MIHLNRYSAAENTGISNDGERIHSCVPHPTKLKQTWMKCGESLGVAVWILWPITLSNTAAGGLRRYVKFYVGFRSVLLFLLP